MTTIVTRLYRDMATAEALAAAMAGVGIPAGDIEVIAGAENAAARMEAARVNPASAALYAQHMESGAALVVVRAGFQPIGAAATAIKMMDSRQPMNAGVANENEYIRTEPKRDLFVGLSVMMDHPLMFGKDKGRRRGLISTAFNIPLLSKRKNRNSVFPGGRHFTTWMSPLLSQKRGTLSTLDGGGQMTRRFFPTVSRHK